MRVRVRPPVRDRSLRQTIGDLFGHFLPPVLSPLKHKPPPWRPNQPDATKVAPGTTYAHARPACTQCGAPGESKGLRHGQRTYRTECGRCRRRRLHTTPSTHPAAGPAKPLALPHGVRPRCAVPTCPNAMRIEIRPIVPRPYAHATWVPPDATKIFMGKAFCSTHKRWADRPVGVLIPRPTHPIHTLAPFRNGKDQWDSWRRRLRRGLGLPRFGRVSHTYTPEGEPYYYVSVTGVGMKVVAWPDLIWAVAFWTARMPPTRRDNVPPQSRTWPTYSSLATAHGVSMALVVWIVWELRVGAISVRGCPIERIPCSGKDPSPFLPPVRYILDPETWTWTTASPTDQEKCATQQWFPQPVSSTPPPGGVPARARLRTPPPLMPKPTPTGSPAAPSPASPQKLTSGLRPIATGPSGVTRYGNVSTKSRPMKKT